MRKRHRVADVVFPVELMRGKLAPSNGGGIPMHLNAWFKQYPSKNLFNKHNPLVWGRLFFGLLIIPVTAWAFTENFVTDVIGAENTFTPLHKYYISATGCSDRY